MDDFDLSGFIKDSIQVTKDALPLEHLISIANAATDSYKSLVNEYPEKQSKIREMFRSSSERSADSVLKIARRVASGFLTASEIIRWGCSYIYNMPTAGNAQRRGVDYYTTIESLDKNDSRLF